MFMNQLCTDFHVVKLTHGVSVQIYTKTTFWECDLMIYIYIYIFVFSWLNSPQWAMASSISMLHDHTQKHHSRPDSSGRAISPAQRPLPDNTQHSQHAHGRFQTHNPRKRASTEPRLKRRDHWDRHFCITDGEKNRNHKFPP